MKQAALNMLVSMGLIAPWSALAQNQIEFEATSGVITGPFITTNGCLFQPIQTDVTQGGCASYSFTITNPGNFVVVVRVDAPNSSANSLYVNIDAAPQDPTMIWDIPRTTGFTNQVVSWRGTGTPERRLLARKAFSLSSGDHQLIIRGRDAGTKLAHISVCRIPASPMNLRIVAVP
jgi:hypothetical protein